MMLKFIKSSSAKKIILGIKKTFTNYIMVVIAQSCLLYFKIKWWVLKYINSIETEADQIKEAKAKINSRKNIKTQLISLLNSSSCTLIAVFFSFMSLPRWSCVIVSFVVLQLDFNAFKDTYFKVLFLLTWY
jgi:hypothetical protein